MGTGWRRALCTSVQRDDGDAKPTKRRQSPRDAASPRVGAGFFFSNKTASNSAPVTPALRCRTKPKEPAPSSTTRMPDPAPVMTPPSVRRKAAARVQALSAPASPRSPSRFALLKASLLPSKSRCGVCSRGVKSSSGGSAVFTAECSHTFHFPCIAAHARSSSSSTNAGGLLSCPVCASPWRQAPFLASLRLHCSSYHDEDDDGARVQQKHHRKAPSSAGAKLYDDDEPLLLPSKAGADGCGGGFNPIPEADVEDDEEKEFGGFFPRPPRNSSSGPAVTVAPEAALVSTGRRHGRYVVAVRVKAPSTSSSAPRRAAIDLVTVLDVSQGMMGEKLQTLKRGMRLVVASLGPADRLSIVAFSGAAKRLLPLRRMTRQGQRSARQIVDRLVVCAAAAAAASQGQEQERSACVGDALRKATKVLEDRRDRNPVATVMLLSDTQQQQQQQQEQEPCSRKQKHHGIGRRRQHPSVVAPATRFTHVEIPICEPLVAKKEEVEEEEHAFAKCLGGLVSVVMQEVHLDLLFPTGEITAVYATGPGHHQQQQQHAVSLQQNGHAPVVVRLGEMYAEEERELLVELRVPLTSSNGARHLLSVRCSYRDPATQETVRGAEQPPLPLPALLHGGGGEGSSSRRLHDVFVATRAVAESRRLAELHDLGTAIHLLSSARTLLATQSPSSQELVGSLDTELSDMRWRRSQQTQSSSSRSGTPTSSSSRRRTDDATSTSTTPRAGASGGEPLTPTSAWRAAEQLAKVAIMRKSMNRVSDLHGFENARF